MIVTPSATWKSFSPGSRQLRALPRGQTWQRHGLTASAGDQAAWTSLSAALEHCDIESHAGLMPEASEAPRVVESGEPRKSMRGGGRLPQVCAGVLRALNRVRRRTPPAPPTRQETKKRSRARLTSARELLSRLDRIGGLDHDRPARSPLSTTDARRCRRLGTLAARCRAWTSCEGIRGGRQQHR